VEVPEQPGGGWPRQFRRGVVLIDHPVPTRSKTLGTVHHCAIVEDVFMGSDDAINFRVGEF